jgi:hypothetical protein
MPVEVVRVWTKTGQDRDAVRRPGRRSFFDRSAGRSENVQDSFKMALSKRATK